MDLLGLRFLAVCLLCLVCSWAEDPKSPAKTPSVPEVPENVDLDSIQPLGTENDDDDGDDDDDNDAMDGPSYQVFTGQPTEPSSPAPGAPPTIAPDLPDFYIRKNGDVCLRAAFHAAVDVKYSSKKSESETNVLQATLPHLPTDAKYTGECGNGTSSLTITWADNTLALTFSEQKSNKTKTGEERKAVLVWAVTSIKLSINTNDSSIFLDSIKPGIHQVTTGSQERHFEAPSNFSYSCATQEEIVLHEYVNGSMDTDIIPSVTLSMWNVAVEAFHMTATGQFNHAAKCAPDVEKELPRQNIVPVAVAACLAGIILVIIVAYFFVKNRYQSPYKGLD